MFMFMYLIATVCMFVSLCVPVCLLNHSFDVILPFLQVNCSSDVEESQTDEGKENREVELKQVSEPDDVVGVKTQVSHFQRKIGSIDLKQVSLYSYKQTKKILLFFFDYKQIIKSNNLLKILSEEPWSSG